MKKSFIYLTLFIFSICVYSQPGVKAGIGLSSFRSDADKSKFKPAFQIGGFYDVRLKGNFYLQPNLLFSHEPAETIYYGEDWTTKYKYKRNYLSLPVILSYRHPVSEKGKIVFDLGGYLALSLSTNYDLVTEKVELNSNGLNHLEVGLIGGVGYEINKYVLSSHLKYGMNTVTDFEDKALVLMFSVGYRF